MSSTAGRSTVVKRLCVLALLVASSGSLVSRALHANETGSQTLVEIPDPNLRLEVEQRLGKVPGDPITRSEMATLEEIVAQSVSQLDGIEHATNLKGLEVRGGSVSGLAPLAPLNALKTLRLGENEISDVASLAGLTALEVLELAGNEVSDLTPLAGMTGLEILDLAHNEVSDLTPLAGLTRLGTLDLARNDLEDDVNANGISVISPLQGLTSLVELNLSENQIWHGWPLAGLVSLRRLNLFANNGIGLINVAWLEDLDALVELNLTATAISDISPMADMTRLEELHLAQNEITDVSPLVVNRGLSRGDLVDLTRNPIGQRSLDVHVPALRERYVLVKVGEFVDIPDEAVRRAVEEAVVEAPGYRYTFEPGDPIPYEAMDWVEGVVVSEPAKDLRGLEFAVNLAGLSGQPGAISSLRPLGFGSPIEGLALPGNAITDLSPLAWSTSMEYLDLSSNQVEDLSPLAAMAALRRVHLSGNAITDLSPLAESTSMVELNLSSNRIADVSSLAGMAALRWLYLDGNAITDPGPLGGLRSLERLDLSNNAIARLSLRSLGSLERLDLSNNAITYLSLGGLTSLEVLDLGNNSLGSLRGISPLDWDRPQYVTVNVLGNPLGVHFYIVDISRFEQHHVRLLYDPPPDDLLSFKEPVDRGLWAAAEEMLESGIYGGKSLVTLRVLDAADRGVKELAGIEQAALLGTLFVDRNAITDLSPLAGLELRVLTLSHNVAEDLDLTPLTDLPLNFLALDGNSIRELPRLSPFLQYLYLADNLISDIGTLRDSGLLELDISGNLVAELVPLRHLRYLHASDNRVRDLSPLGVRHLRELHLSNNAVSNLSMLLDGGELLLVDVRRNPLADDALRVLSRLRERGVTVLAGERVPYFPAAAGGREGFVRVINRSEEAGHAFIEAVDDAGVRAEPVRLELGAREAVHFNSRDLELGNVAKGLASIGAPTVGDWRLSVISALDVEVLSYIRTEDGFVTAMHDVAADAMASFFNPGSNRNQRSILRVVNTESDPAKWTTGGYDDRGSWHPMTGSLLVRPQHALTLTAQELEDAHGLGDGSGKWRLRVRGFPWFAMSLLESPTGHLTNLSTAPAHTTQLEDGATMHRLPLFPAAGGSREGFARVINRSDTSGEVTIWAVDDGGTRSGPVRLTVDSRHVVHFNSADLEGGNAAKGLAGGVGDGEGDWRLELTSELDLMVLAYARTADGFLTSVHDLAPVVEDDGHRVVFFNPGSNTNQVSRLRVINDGARAASVAATGVDDRGVDSGMVAFTVPAGSAVGFTSAELEAGDNPRLSGGLGDGAGKWRLRVVSDEPIAVMSLLETPSGHLTNVSTGGLPRRRPSAPTAQGTIPDQQVVTTWDSHRGGAVGEATVDLSAYFEDDRALAFSAASSDSELVAASVAGSVLTLTVVGNGGRATITVTARDAVGYIATQRFEVVVVPKPRARATIPDQQVVTTWDPHRGGAVGEATVDLSAYFEESRALAFSATSSDPGVVGASVAGSVLTLTVVANGGRATITVTARYADGYVATQAFQAVVAASEPPRFQDCPECPEMVVVPAGSFMQGAPVGEEGSDPTERPVHQVNFAAPFAIGVYEVTFEQWDACIADGGCGSYEPWTNHIGSSRANRPVRELSWHDAQAYVAWLSDHTGEAYRLPSESEWEYAARAGTTTPFYFGETISTEQAAYDGSIAYGDGTVGETPLHTSPVGSFPANAWGLHDVHGNVYEWTLDCREWGGDYTDAPTDGGAWEAGDCDFRSKRGGWFYSPPAEVRSAHRRLGTPDHRDGTAGIRVVRTYGDPPASAVEMPDAQ